MKMLKKTVAEEVIKAMIKIQKSTGTALTSSKWYYFIKLTCLSYISREGMQNIKNNFVPIKKNKIK